ncbi:hypothetical protein CVT26_010933 [Gymnopilus dilepis]|uniref:Enoyl-CoA hydratase n=1 Tax=Gymnopilus dilepis TaxID=231916 RepID=A0A409VIY6_9AGAR|nr:hypothetical protein CVT26_010933 [Gymnopilus dilepis]
MFGALAERYSSKWINVFQPSEHVLLVELARPPANAFCKEFWLAYQGLFNTLANDRHDIRALVVSSAFPKYFCAGLDLEEASDLGSTADLDSARASFAKRDMILAFQAALGSVEKASFPVIAAIHGHCIGIGVDMLGPCDVRYAASDAKFSIKEIDVGLAPGIGTLAFLPNMTGNHSLLRELAYTSRIFSAAEAEKFGLVSKVVEGGRGEVVKEALILARLIASKSPVAIFGSKTLLTHSRDNPTTDTLAHTALWNSSALHTNVRHNF